MCIQRSEFQIIFIKFYVLIVFALCDNIYKSLLILISLDDIHKQVFADFKAQGVAKAKKEKEY